MANATALTGRTGIQINLDTSQLDAAKLASTLDKLNLNVGIDWKYGTGDSKADLLYHATLTATNAQAAVDISGTAIQDAYGDDVDFSLLKLICIKNTDATEDLLLGGDAAAVPILSDKLSDILLLPPSGIFLWVDPAGIDVTINKNLKIQAETAHVTYDIVLMGEKT